MTHASIWLQFLLVLGQVLMVPGLVGYCSTALVPCFACQLKTWLQHRALLSNHIQPLYGSFALVGGRSLAITPRFLPLRGGVGVARKTGLRSVTSEVGNDGHDEEFRSTSRSRGGTKKFLVDVDAEGNEVSRRKKPKGRTPTGYQQASNGEWIKVISSASAGQGKISMSRMTNLGVTGEDGDGSLLRGTRIYEPNLENSMSRSSLPPLSDVNDLEEMSESLETVMIGENAPCLDDTLWKTPPPKWVVFSDLHVSKATLDTCLRVLDIVHEEAKSREAGVIFLGDFWHERGLLRVEPLNAGK
jgi:hypothetical protein